jgi:2-oxo-3-hexenedioate decarboxylase
MAALNASLAPIADRLDAAFVDGRQIASISATEPAFDVGRAYDVLADLHARRIARGWRPLGRKIGFTNTTLWRRYGVDRAMWSHVWDRTVQEAPDGHATMLLDGLMEPRIEPEIVFGLAGPLPDGDDPVEVLRAVAWMAPGFEIVQSPYPDWRFTAADVAAAYGLHGRLAVGPRVAIDDTNRARVAADLPSMAVSLLRGDTLVDTGAGVNVLGSPVLALMHLRDVLAKQPWAPPLAAGEIVTTGTLTDAYPVRPGETWRASYGALGLRGVSALMR